MYTLRRILARFRLTLLSLACTSQVFAAEQVAPHEHSWPWWHQGHAHAFWWIFPLMFFVFMFVVFIFMMRRGGMGCMWCDRMMGGTSPRDAMKRDRGEEVESAQEILDKRYAKGEIDKQEYEEKKAVLTRSGRG
jgi:uncharacterized membrane protein